MKAYGNSLTVNSLSAAGDDVPCATKNLSFYSHSFNMGRTCDRKSTMNHSWQRTQQS